MLLKNKIFYTYSDVTIVPSDISDICHRGECNPFYEDGKLPIFTAPMDTVVNKDNFDLFESEGVNAILPRTESLSDRVNFAICGKWAAFSLSEFNDVFVSNKVSHNGCIKALIDIANGHMRCLLESVKAAKEIYGSEIIIMAGNIANPKTYLEYAKAGVDYVRCGIGGGSGCISTSNTGTHMPMASLISITKEVKNSLKGTMQLPKIIADGGIRNYSDVIKAIALGADYVMCGGIFSKMLESAAPKMIKDYKLNLRFPIERYEKVYKEGDTWFGDYTQEFYESLTNETEREHHEIGDLYVSFYGMASREGQIALNGEKTKTSEGLKKVLKVEYTMHGWIENMRDYLRSAMSYTNSKTLEDLQEAMVIVNSPNAVTAVNK